jgi:hypothetical protein
MVLPNLTHLREIEMEAEAVAAKPYLKWGG